MADEVKWAVGDELPPGVKYKWKRLDDGSLLGYAVVKREPADAGAITALARLCLDSIQQQVRREMAEEAAAAAKLAETSMTEAPQAKPAKVPKRQRRGKGQ